MANMFSCARRGSRIAFRRAVGHPHIALLVDEQSVRKADRSLPEALDHLAVERDLNDRIEVRVRTAIGSAAVDDPKILAVGIHLEAACDTDLAALNFVPVVIDVVRIAGRLRLYRTECRQQRDNAQGHETRWFQHCPALPAK